MTSCLRSWGKYRAAFLREPNSVSMWRSPHGGSGRDQGKYEPHTKSHVANTFLLVRECALGTLGHNRRDDFDENFYVGRYTHRRNPKAV